MAVVCTQYLARPLRKLKVLIILILVVQCSAVNQGQFSSVQCSISHCSAVYHCTMLSFYIARPSQKITVHSAVQCSFVQCTAVFLVSMLLSVHVKRFSVSHIQDLYSIIGATAYDKIKQALRKSQKKAL